jgi:ribosomal protein S18 acetylase RimI-like enzyme
MSAPATAGIVVAPAETDVELLELAAVRRANDPHANLTLENLRHAREAFGATYLLARVNGEVAGCAFVGEASDDDPFADADVSVLPSSRGRGVGSALLREVSRRARTTGKRGLTVETREDDPASLAWLERRGFTEVERQKAVALDLAAAPAEQPAPLPGVEIVRRADRPGLEQGMYRVAIEAGRDIPGLDGEHAPTFERWRSFEIDRPSRRPELSFVALAGDEVVGFASLDVFGESDSAYHGLTCTAPAWRRRGIAEALKRSEIRAARAAGLARLVTESEERNVAMRRLNEKLGYVPEPGMVVLRGALS